MSSIDELFKRPNGTTAGVKRKPEAPPRSIDEIRKSAKTSINGDAKGKQHATVEDDAAGDDLEDDIEAGPELPPDDDEEEAGPMPEDEEGARFFGGGTTRHTNDVLDYMDSREDENFELDKIDKAWLRRTMVGFEKKINKNTELRSKYADDPMKFIESEGELDADIKNLSVLSEHPELYPELAKMGSVNSLVQLLIHENVDIAINAVQIMAELTDEDVSATEEQWNALANGLVEADVVDLLLEIVRSLDEERDEDRAGVYHAMELLENLANNAETLAKVLSNDDQNKMLKYLLERAQKPERPVSQNKQYAAELISIIASQVTPNTADSASARTRLLNLNTVDIFLQLLAPYRKSDPSKSTDEEQFAEDAFDVLDCLVDSAEGKSKFLEAEGTELCLIMMREGGKFSKSQSLRLLDHTMSGSSSSSIAVCQRFVEIAGLKPLFKTFATIADKRDREGLEHVLGLIASLLRCLPGDSSERIRTLAKFTQKNHQKLKKIVLLREEYLKRLEPVTRAIDEERQSIASPFEREEKEVDWIARRLEAGLYTFQTLTVILSWLYAEDEEAAKQIRGLLSDAAGGPQGLANTLSDQLVGIGAETEDEKNSRDMLQTLIDCIR
ncbi:MAG: hypothetical protein Q9162_002930 [Coniocarpon cinnabarinum]